MRKLAFALAALALGACSPQPSASKAEDAAQTSAPAAEFNQAAAEAELLAWAREKYPGTLIEPISTFFGDFTGDGAPDALAIAYFEMGGSGAGIMPAIFRNEGGHMVFAKEVEVYGQEPKDAVFSVGSITVTTLMPGPNDPHCCPTEPREWTISTD